jgi:hypothetical protein
MKIRWLIWMCGIVFLFIAYLRGAMIDVATAFILGSCAGFFIDWLGVKIMHLWRYPRQPFLGGKYFAIVVPAWGIFGVAVNFLWDWIGVSWLAILSITTALFLLHELPNLKTRSWEYSVPMWLVGCGWVPLIIFFRLIFVVIH